MKYFFAVMTLVSFFSIPANATPLELQCGDHWFNATVTWDDATNNGQAYFGGDSQVERDSSPASIEILDGNLTVSFLDAQGGYLTVRNFVDGANSGLLRETINGHELSIAPCNLR